VAYGTLVGAGVGIVFMAVPSTRRLATRVVVVAFTAMIAGGASGYAWTAPLREPRWAEEIAAGRARGSFTLVPHSPNRGATERGFLAPGASGADAAVRAVLQLLEHRAVADQPPTRVAMTPVLLEEIESAVVSSGPGDAVAEAIVRDLRVRSAAGRLADGRAAIAAIEFHGGPRHLLGTDGFGCDVLSQFLHACRLSISIGLVSTGIAVFIGVTIGAIMGYFGGVIDLVLSRVVETFMAVPLLFLLIVAAGVLPPDLRGTYAMMAIIGCFSWTGAARFTRAEFLKLRGQDFVQSARALGLPLRSILFRHMLPNGLTPVLVDASFAIAAAITIEATLSFLGLGPVDQPSWGRLLAGAYDHSGVFRWWLAAVPGGAVFLTVLSYNLIGESFRDALDPRAPGNLPR
jgi:ABC-type dipeptide/oligopeptide/nickel transport system permease subunit